MLLIARVLKHLGAHHAPCVCLKEQQGETFYILDACHTVHASSAQLPASCLNDAKGFMGVFVSVMALLVRSLAALILLAITVPATAAHDLRSHGENRSASIVLLGDSCTFAAVCAPHKVQPTSLPLQGTCGWAVCVEALLRHTTLQSSCCQKGWELTVAKD